MRALTRGEVIDLALEDAALLARAKFKKEFKRADRIKRGRGWQPWWTKRAPDAPKRVGAR